MCSTSIKLQPKSLKISKNLINIIITKFQIKIQRNPLPQEIISKLNFVHQSKL